MFIERRRTNFQIKVTETLKGKVEERIINGTTVTEDGLLGGCSFFPNEKGEYLFYLKETKKKWGAGSILKGTPLMLGSQGCPQLVTLVLQGSGTRAFLSSHLRF